MEIISLSLDDKTLSKINEIREKASFNGRSEMIRKAIENLHQDLIELENIKGDINAVIVVRHPHKHEHGISNISHSFDEIITTQLHNKLNKEKCLEIFNVKGKAQKIIELQDQLEGSKHTEAVDILIQK